MSRVYLQVMFIQFVYVISYIAATLRLSSYYAFTNDISHYQLVFIMVSVYEDSSTYQYRPKYISTRSDYILLL